MELCHIIDGLRLMGGETNMISGLKSILFIHKRSYVTVKNECQFILLRI